LESRRYKKMETGLQGKIALVTGSGRGIGRALKRLPKR